ncbi:hypothetical protein L0M84_11525, partial [Bifidobacterium longum]
TSVRVRRKNGKTGLVFDHVAILRQEVTSMSLGVHFTSVWVQNIVRVGKSGFHFQIIVITDEKLVIIVQE